MRRTGGGGGGVWRASDAHGGGLGAIEAHGGGLAPGALALTRRTGGGGLALTRRTGGGGGLVLMRRASSPICASYNEVCSFSQTLVFARS